LTQSDFTAQCQGAKSAGVTLLALAVDGSAMDRVARSCSALGYHPAIATAAVAIGAAQSADPGLQADTIGLGSLVFPWTQADNPAEQAFQTAMKTYAPGVAPDGPSAGAWTSGMLLKAAVDKLGTAGRDKLTPALILQGLGMIKNEALGGLTAPLTFTAGQPAPSGSCVFPMLLKPGGWTAPNKSTYICL
jgi:branched-chain amino acid transport system substrate-binding protein